MRTFSATSLKLFVMSAIHHTHAAGAELGDNTVVRYGATKHASSYAFPVLARKTPVTDLHCCCGDCIKSAFDA